MIANNAYKYLCLLLLGACTTTTPDAGKITRICQVMPELMGKHHVPGVALAAIVDRRICWSREFGVQEAGAPETIKKNSVFEACSMSKPLFSYVVMQLVEAGQLDLDRPLDAYLEAPYLPDQPEAGRITARMVMNHTTGLPNWRKGGWRKGGPIRLKAKPGENYTYSGEGFTYLQKVIAKLLKQPVNQFMRERLMLPIGMAHSSYVWEKRFTATYAHGHDKHGKPKNRDHYYHANTAFSLYTTPGEYARFLLTMLETGPQGKHRLLPTTLDQMLSREKAYGQGRFKGLGWSLKAAPEGDYAFHGGANGAGFRCFSRFDRARGTGFVIMTNSDSGKALYTKILEIWYGP